MRQLPIPYDGVSATRGRIGGTAKALCQACAVYGVEPEAGNDGQQIFGSGKIVRIEMISSASGNSRKSNTPYQASFRNRS